jgi:hypothetical protein
VRDKKVGTREWSNGRRPERDTFIQEHCEKCDSTYDWLSSAQTEACRLYDTKQILSYQSSGLASLEADAAYDLRMYGMCHLL